jgi:diguanylate cyclase (GGDEF)-like protein
MHAKRFEELKATGLLPSPTGVGVEILRLTRDETTSANDIANVLRADPALTGRTLRLANTGNAAASRPVTNINDAVARLGTRTVAAVALGFTILAGTRSGKCRAFDYRKYWSHSLAMAVGTQAICGLTRQCDGPDAFTAGLLAQIGKLALASIHAEQYSTVLDEWNGGAVADLKRLEQQAFITDHGELGAAMLADWGLPPFVCEAVQHLDQPEELNPRAFQLGLTLRAAAQIADVCVAKDDARAAVCAIDLVDRCEAVGVGADALLTLFDDVFTQWAEWGRILDVETLESRRLAELIEAGRSLDAIAVPAAGAAWSESSNTSAAAPHAEPPGGDPDPEGLLVLVADPDPQTLRFLERFLLLSGHRVRCASGGREALHVFFEFAPHLVVVDASLPEIGGLEFCRRLRETNAGRQAYIIMLTSPDDEETIVRLFDAGADDFVTKPFAARPLFARVRASLRVVALQQKVSRDREEIERVRSELAVAHRRLEQDALTDVLTGLPNRRYLIDRLAHEWAAARRGGTPLACMMLDIDHFKLVNDTYGHDVGDAVLRAVADVLQREVRGTDVPCRLGGEEFVIVSASDLESTTRCAERLREAIEQQVFGRVNELKQRITISIGVAVRSERTRSPEALLKAADEALFIAKRNGRNRVATMRDCAAEPSLPAPSPPDGPPAAIDLTR